MLSCSRTCARRVQGMFVRFASFEVDETYVNTRVDKFIMDKYPRVPYTIIQKVLRNRKVVLISNDENNVKRKMRCQPGDRFFTQCHILLPDFFAKVESEEKSDISESKPIERRRVDLSKNIIFEDSHLIVVDKPSGFCCQPTKNNDLSIVQILQLMKPSSLLYPVHRLDRGTSGVFLLAKDRETARLLSHEIACGYIEKDYITLCLDNQFSTMHYQKKGLIYSDMIRTQDYDGSLFIAKNCSIRPLPNDLFPKHLEGSSQFPAITGYNVLDIKNRVAAIQCRLYTGKTHQIRVHMHDALGFEIINDQQYGERDNKKKSSEVMGMMFRKNAMMLHCRQVSVNYNGKLTKFTAELPRRFTHVIERFDLDCSSVI